MGRKQYRHGHANSWHLHKNADFPSINYLWKRTLIVRNYLAFGIKLNFINLQMRSSTIENVILEQGDAPTSSVFMKYIYLCADAH